MLNEVQVFVNVCPSLFETLSTKQDITSTEISYQFLAPKVPFLRRNKVTRSSTSTDPFSAATKTLVLGNLYRHVWFAITFARAVCHWREWQEWDDCQIFFIFIPKWQTTFRANVMSSLKTLGKLPKYIRAFVSAAEKWTVRSTGLIGFISPQNWNLRR